MMSYAMACKQHQQTEGRFWFVQKRLFGMPVLEKQEMRTRSRS